MCSGALPQCQEEQPWHTVAPDVDTFIGVIEHTCSTNAVRRGPAEASVLQITGPADRENAVTHNAPSSGAARPHREPQLA